MTNSTATYRGLLLKAPLHFNIIAIFIAIFLMLAGGLIWYNYRTNSELALEAADSLLGNVSEKVLERTENFIQNPITLVRLTSGLPGVTTRPRETEHPTVRYFLDALDSYSQLYGLFIGYGNGDFFQTVNFTDVDAVTRERLLVPENARYGVRLILKGDDGKRMQTWRFLDAKRKVVKTLPSTEATYDPRVRPWYKSALDKNETSMTNAYIFSSLKAPGITVSHKIHVQPDAVMAVDITLSRLSSFLQSQKVGMSGRVLIYNHRNELIAYPDVDKTVMKAVEGTKVVLRPVKVSELKLPAITEAIRRFDGQEDGRRVYSVNGEDHIASVSTLQNTVGSTKRVAIVVPVDDFIGPIAAHRIRSLLFSLVPLLLSIPMIAWVSEWIARPIRQIVDETKKIRNFEFENSQDVVSRVTEIHELSDSVATMRNAIETFAHYVPKALVEQLIQSGNQQQLGGERRQLSIMFTDVAGFTDMSEQMSPEALMLKTTRYFQALGEIVLENQGSIDKFIGDAIMAFWNAPLDDPNHVANACRTMLLCKARSAELNASWAAQGEPIMRTRFGLHTGDTVVGNIGSADRMDYTALGASVNLAARLEGLNKEYGTELLVSESVYQLEKNACLFRPVDVARVKGISKPVRVYELCAALEGPENILATAEQRALCLHWAPIYQEFSQGNWSAARDGLQRFVAEYPDDSVAAKHLDHCTRKLAEADLAGAEPLSAMARD
ncbi:MAG: adenylate/guanylate cyclase domain-containing protein [Alphaproteobacteria bacterium]|nr:adenylate/guanylate cyclase domain-containing protein [Alphaproteobacteria bacterium]